MHIGHCSEVNGLIADLCFAPRENLETTEQSFDSKLHSVSFAKYLDDLALKGCLSRFISKAFLYSGDSEQSLQQSIVRRFQACALVDIFLQENKNNGLDSFSSYV
jgi:hypothetical protein